MQAREKAKKMRLTVFFQWFVAPEGRKVGSLKRRVRSHVVRWEMKSCTMLHAVVARSTFASETAQNTSRSDHFWKLSWKSAHRCGEKHICKWKSSKQSAFGALLEVDMSKKCTQLWKKAHLQVKQLKTPHVRSTFGSWYVEKAYNVAAWSTFATEKAKKHTRTKHFWTFQCRFVWQAQGIVHLVKKVSKTWGFYSGVKSIGRRGTFEEDLQRGISCGRRSTRDMSIRDVRRSGSRFPERVAFWSIQSLGLLQWFCVTGALPMTWPHFFVAGAILYTDVGKIAEKLRFWAFSFQI